MYRVAIEGLLGLCRRADSFSIDPCIPARWDGYTMEWRLSRARYRITVTNPEHRSRGVQSATLDAAPVDARAIPLADDDMLHEVAIVIGATPSPDIVGGAGVRAGALPRFG
jgi:cyclic beta-1,2-glucan synthetase